ncbi:MobA/MobL family protein, partial [Roseibium sp. TrichSKD4]|uniref:MobA/MobL family protein n=1 Tax=Roseibium sp. TrichSKD4 TaxID=744980 RepID=UPI00067FEF11
GTRLRNDSAGRGYSSFTHLRRRVLATGIVLPPHAPSWMQDRAELWNAVERHNVRSNAQLGRRIIVALPYAIPREQWLATIEGYAGALSERYGVAVDYALHQDDAETNPHAHLIITDNAVTPEGLGGKIRELGRQAFYYDVRDLWEKHGNAALAEASSSTRIFARSYAARGVQRTPTKHRGIGRGQPVPERAREFERDHDMSNRPTAEERLKYPRISRQETWPPSLERCNDAAERAEFARYQNDIRVLEQQHEREQEVEYRSMMDAPEHIQREYDEYVREHDANIPLPLPEHEDELDRDVSYIQPYKHEKLREHDRQVIERREEADELRRRARDMYLILPKHERDQLAAVERLPFLERGEARREAQERIMADRIAELKERDQRERAEKLQREIENAARERERERERDDERER